MDLKIYIPTSNRTVFTIEALQHSYRKYWPDYTSNTFTILGYEKPGFELDSNWEFIQLNDFDDVHNWAQDLKGFFENIEDDFFIYANDDCPLSRPVDTDLLNKLFKLTDSNTSIGRISLTADVQRRPHTTIASMESFDLIESGPLYRLSTQYGIWNRNFFLKYIKGQMTPWDFETIHPVNDGYNVLATKNRYCIDFYHLWRKTGLCHDWSESAFEKTQLKDNAEDYTIIKRVLNL